jgi:putative ABC transport system permease protein
MLGRLLTLFRRRRLDAELASELEFHLERLEAEHRARGLSPDEARRAARLDMGGITRLTEEYRDQQRIPFLETSWRNLWFGIRSLARTPGVTTAVAITVAVGIGANAAIFAVVNGVLLKPLPFPDADTLVAVNHGMTGTTDELPSAPYLYFTYREENRAFEGIGLWGIRAVNITGLDRPEQVRALYVTSEILPVLRIQPMLGRQFSPQDDLPNAPPTVLLTHGYWQRRFGGDSSVVGRTLVVDVEPRYVIGVMPSGFRFLDNQVDVIAPFQLDRSQVTLGRYVFPSLARLKVGVTLADANADIARMVPLAIERFPPPPGYTRERFALRPVTPRLTPLKETVIGNIGSMLWVLMGALALLLLIACANVANLLLVRTDARQRELAIRAALGASRARIAGELLVESTLLGLMGGALGLALAHQALQAVKAFGPANLPRLDEITMAPLVLLFTLILSLLSGVLFGLLPILRYANPKVALALRTGGRTMSDSRERHRARAVLVTIQVATALVLLVSSGLMLRTFQALSHVDPGFVRPEEVQMVRLSVPFGAVPEPERATRMQQEILSRISAVPGVVSAAFADVAPLDPANRGSDTVLFVDGRSYAPGQARPLRRFEFISPGFFQTLGTPIVAGRDLTWADFYGKRPVALVSEKLAREEWQSAAGALGKRVRASPADPWREVVGVVGNMRDNGMHLDPPGIVYFPSLMDRFWGAPTVSFRSATFLVRSSRAGTEGFLRDVHAAVWAVNGNLALAEVRTLNDAYQKSLAGTSFTLVLLAMAGGMGLLLGAIGIYGVIAYVVSQRAGEIGVRLALGAQPRQVRRQFVREAMMLTAAGVAMGLGAAALLTRVMSSLLFGISRLDPLTYTLMTLVLIVVAMAAAYVPARRASLNDPLEALRAG